MPENRVVDGLLYDTDHRWLHVKATMRHLADKTIRSYTRHLRCNLSQGADSQRVPEDVLKYSSNRRAQALR